MSGGPRNRNERAAADYGLSPTQADILLHGLNAAQAGTDLEQVICRLPEEINRAALERAWQRALERHDILRTAFRWQTEGEPRQTVEPHVQVRIETHDWRGLSPVESAGRLETFVAMDRRRGFDPGSPPLMRWALFRTGPAEYRFVWSFHHLLLDGEAATSLLKEVFCLYEAFARGEELVLPSPQQYRTYIEWLERFDTKPAETYWRRALAGFTTPTPLLMGCPRRRTTGADHTSGECETRINESATRMLASLAAEHGLTLNAVLLGAWALVLSRYSGEEDVAFGAVHTGRPTTGEAAESMVGVFMNTAPMRVKLPSGQALIPWLKELEAQQVEVRRQAHVSVSQVQSWSEVPRDCPLFETIITCQDRPWETLLRAQGGRWADRGFSFRSQSSYPLAVEAYAGRELVIKVLYHENRFDAGTITRLLGHLRMLLAGMAGDPSQCLGALPLLTEDERRQLLTEWNETRLAIPWRGGVHQLFEQQAQRAPEALAVADGVTKLTYRQLDEQAGRLAGRLSMLGVGAEAPVGIWLERSCDFVVAVLGVLKAGGAYLPLDPCLTGERVAEIVKDAGAPVLITTERRRQQAGGPPEITTLCLESLIEGEAVRSSVLSVPFGAPPCGPHSLAYIIYSSDSTGAPRGVEIEQRSLLNLVVWHQRAYQVTAADRAALLAGPASDTAPWELWPYLTAGASIHIPNDVARRSPKRLVAWLAGKRITLAFAPTPLAESMLDEPWPDKVALRTLLTGGDKLRRACPRRLPCALVNHYGPTENTVVTTRMRVAPSDEAPAGSMIGQPIANTLVYVLDHHLRPVPIGVPGELCIGGAGLARGYRGRSKLTEERFIPNPFSRSPGGRLYKTGDLVRYHPNGNLEFLGRLDQQVKLHGNRVELTEIEWTLNRHPAVREAVVLARVDEPAKPRLVAYVVVATHQPPSSAYLRDFMKRSLPCYMVPSVFVLLPALPRTSHGLVDRQALPEPNPATAAESPPVTPRTPTEDLVAGVWRETLRQPRVGIHDNFFDLGGDSSVATQIISRIHARCHTQVLLQDILDFPTVAEFAERVERLLRLRARPTPQAIAP